MVSVIVPIFNTDKYLDECIASILNQSYKDLECILVNDGSTDNSLEICKKWKEKDQRIILINKKNGGQGKARNEGIEIAKGKYILFVDSDDYIETFALEKILHKMEKEKSDICIFSYYAHGKERISLVDPVIMTKTAHSIEECNNLLCHMSPMLWDKMYTAKLLKNAKYLMDDKICEDLLFLPQLYVNARRISTFNQACYHYRVMREGNISTNYQRYSEIEENVRELFARFQSDKIFKKYWKELFCISFDIFKDILFRIGGKRKDFPAWQETKKLYPKYLKRYEDCLTENFDRYIETKLLRSNFVIIGSYNLRIIVRTLLLEESHLNAYYGASCIESFMSERAGWEVEYIGKPENEYREKQITQDITGEILNTKCIDNCDYIIIDFLDQINDLLDVGTGYITISDFSRKRIRFDIKK